MLLGLRRRSRHRDLLRLVWVYPATYLPRLLIASLPAAIRRRRPAFVILGWGGMRGASPLRRPRAPVETAPATVPRRGLVIFLAFTVILVTLIGQGLTLPG